jgi:hypothetical protein
MRAKMFQVKMLIGFALFSINGPAVHSSVQKPEQTKITLSKNRDYNKFAHWFCRASGCIFAPILCVDFYECSVKFGCVDGRKGSRSKICQPEKTGRSTEQGDLQGSQSAKILTALRGAARVWHRESGDRIKGL